MEKTGFAEKIIMALILCAMGLLGVLFFVLPKKTFSENENRNLAAFPEWKTEELTGGVYTGKIEEYLADHFPARDAWMMLATEADRLSGKSEINGVYLAEGGRLIDIYEKTKDSGRMVNSVVRLSEALPETNIALMLVPGAQQVYQDLLPAFAPEKTQEETAWQRETIEEVYRAVEEQTEGTVVTVDPAWSEKAEESSYYRTDHHWTIRGARLGYDAWRAATGRPEEALREESISLVSDSFRGTTWSKLNDPLIAPDTMHSYWDDTWDLSVTFTDTGEETDTPYGEEWLTKKDKYAYYLNGLHPLVIIENRAVPEEQGAIAVVKDSYANSMIPYMISDFHRIYVFDTRYWRQGISSYVQEHPDITEILILYSATMLDTDAGIGGIF
ncbi:MAG: hypothetical protein IJR00_06815 [Lachnospiraceae bacterium]|nr:hypothetical protein [Lachnospiraceae bacterium]